MAETKFEIGAERNPEDVLYRRYEIPEELGEPGSIADGRYGAYRLSAEQAEGFRQSAEFAPWRERFQDLTPGTEDFDRAWTAAGAELPADFTWAQYDFVDRTVVQPQAELLEKQCGIDIASRPDGVRNLFFAGALEFGAGSTTIPDALGSAAAELGLEKPEMLTDHDVAEAILNARSQGKPPEVQEMLQAEFRDAEGVPSMEFDLLEGRLGVPYELSASYAGDRSSNTAAATPGYAAAGIEWKHAGGL